MTTDPIDGAIAALERVLKSGELPPRSAEAIDKARYLLEVLRSGRPGGGGLPLALADVRRRARPVTRQDRPALSVLAGGAS